MAQVKNHVLVEFQPGFGTEVAHNCVESEGLVLVAMSDEDATVVWPIHPSNIEGFAQMLLAEAALHAEHRAQAESDLDAIERAANETPTEGEQS